MKSEITYVKRLVLKRAIVIGFCGGLIWSSLLSLLYYFNMIEVNPVVLVKLIVGDIPWTHTIYAHGLVILSMAFLSIIAAVIYYACLKSIESWLGGLLYGIFIWSVLFILSPLIIKKFEYFGQHDISSHISIICVCLLYGLFIGYSISYDYQSLKLEHLESSSSN